MPSSYRLGLRSQLLVGLCAVALVAVLSTGFVALLVARQSYAASEEEAARALARTAATLLQAARDPRRSFAEDVRVGALGVAAQRLGHSGTFVRVLVVDRSGKTLITTRADEAPDPAMTMALEGIERTDRVERPPGAPEGTGTELRAFLPLRGPEGIEGGLGLTLSLETPLSAADTRSRRLLVGLGLVDAAVILLVGAFLLERLIVRPVTELERAALRIARGEPSPRVSEDGPGEVGRLAASFNRMTQALEGKVAELEARTRELAASREQLVRAEKLASVGRLAAGLAHEIGNPLSAMLGYVEILRSPGPAQPDVEQWRDVLERLHREIERVHHLMQDLLAYSRPSPERCSEVDVAEIIGSAVALLKPQRRFQELDLRCEIATDLPAAKASPGRLTQVLVNLLLNAADAVGGRGRVEVRARRQHAAVVVEVADAGPGVAPEIRDRIFDPFFTTKEPGEGTGLGLATSVSLCESFGATLTLVDTPPGEGATFAIHLGTSESEAAPIARF
jgi:two-component system, NtrC family, sensor kinase